MDITERITEMVLSRVEDEQTRKIFSQLFRNHREAMRQIQELRKEVKSLRGDTLDATQELYKDFYSLDSRITMIEHHPWFKDQ